MPIGSTGLYRVEKSLEITNRILNEHKIRLLQEAIPTIKLGRQEWMIKNLDVDCYSNGDPITHVPNIKEWKNLTKGAWCYYDNKIENKFKYGRIYNWYAIADVRNICPNGFRVPNEQDWLEFIAFLGGRENAYAFLFTNHKSNFKLHLGGYINNGLFCEEGESCFFWSLSKFNNGDDCKTWNYGGGIFNEICTFDDEKNQGFYLILIKN